MLNDYCFSTYARYTTLSRSDGAVLMGADNLVGDIYTIEPELQEDRSYRLWLVNRFGAKVAILDQSHEHRVQTLLARGWTLRALLSFVALSDGDEGTYWGEVILLGNDPHYDEAFKTFALNLRELLSEGVRPQVEFTEQAARQIINSNGCWMPTDRISAPKLGKGSALVKSRRSASEKLVEAGRSGKGGCWAITIALWIAIGALVLAGAAKLLGLF